MVSKQDIPLPVTVDDITISGKILATNVSHDEFMAGYDGMRVEWVNGTVVEMPGVDETHDDLVIFLRIIFKTYLEKTGGGRAVGDPVLMRLAGISTRAPDIQVLLPERKNRLKKNFVTGAANLVVEVVSPGTERTDRVAKFSEYERGGVPEYWILDQRHKEAHFYQLNSETQQYERVEPDENGVYHSQALPRLRIKVSDLWFIQQPETEEILALVKAMLAE
jgi:Uma2 family endonuclease